MARGDIEGVGKTVEDYLEAILMIKEKQGYVRSIDVAKKLGVTKPSVTYTTKRLKESGYITTDPAGMLVLTETGMRIADATYTRHKKLSDFFTMLGVNPETARADACRIEHDISEETFQAICRHAQQYEKKPEKK
jgi:DtxR family Mn-dependent transcriptional regulator